MINALHVPLFLSLRFDYSLETKTLLPPNHLTQIAPNSTAYDLFLPFCLNVYRLKNYLTHDNPQISYRLIKNGLFFIFGRQRRSLNSQISEKFMLTVIFGLITVKTVRFISAFMTRLLPKAFLNSHKTCR